MEDKFFVVFIIAVFVFVVFVGFYDMKETQEVCTQKCAPYAYLYHSNSKRCLCDLKTEVR